MLSKIISAALLLAVSAVSFAGAQEAVRELTLPESIDSGISNSQELLVIKEQMAIAQQRVNEALSLRYPKIDFNLSASESQSDSPMVLSQSFDNIYIPGGNGQYYSTRFTLWQYLYAAGRYTNNLRLAETNLSQAKSQSDIARIKAIKDITVSFYSLIALRDRKAACETALREVRERSNKSANRQYWLDAEGELVLKLQVLKHDYEKAKLVFLNSIGAELNTEFDLRGEILAPSEEYEYNKCLAWALEYRPELRQTQFQEAIDSLRVNLSMAERYPTITTGANYEWIGNQFPLPKTNWSATVNLNVPIFDGWASWSRIKQRRFAVREGKVRRSKIENQISLEVKQAYLDFVFWKERLSAVEKLPSVSDPVKKLENKIQWIETAQQAVTSKAMLEWAVGKHLIDAGQNKTQ